MNGPTNSNNEEPELPEEEDLDEEEENEDMDEFGDEEEDLDFEEEEEWVEDIEAKDFKERIDALGFFSYLIFICVVFFLLISFWQGTYPFIPVARYNIFLSFVGYEIVLQDKLAFYILYGVGFGCLLIGLWRYKYEYWLIILVAILGTMLFFMFFYQP